MQKQHERLRSLSQGHTVELDAICSDVLMTAKRGVSQASRGHVSLVALKAANRVPQYLPDYLQPCDGDP